MWKSPPSSSLTHSPASSTSAANAGYPPRRPSRDPSPPGAGAGYDRNRYGGGGGYGPSSPATAYNTYETARRGGGDPRSDRDRPGFDDLDDQPPAPTQDRRQYYSHARSPSPPPSSIPRSPRPVYDDRGFDASGSNSSAGWQPRPRRPSARPASADIDDEPGYDRRYRYQQQPQQQPQRNGSFSTVAMSPRSGPVAGLSPTQLRPGQVYPRDAEADVSPLPRYPPATIGRQPSFLRQQQQEPVSPVVKPATPVTSGNLKGSANKEDGKPKNRGCLDWTRWLLAGSIARFIMVICLIVLGLHSFMCGGGAMFLLVIIPIAGWSADGSLSIFGFRVSPPPAPPAGSTASTALDAPYALTILGVFLLVGVFVDLLSTFAAFKLAHRKLPGLVALGLAEVTQIVRVVFLVLMINQAKNVEGWEQQSETLARVFVVVEIIQLVTAAALYFTARWRWTEKQKFQGTAAANTNNVMSSSSSTLDPAARRPSDIEMQKPGSTATADRQSGKGNPKMRFHW